MKILAIDDAKGELLSIKNIFEREITLLISLHLKKFNLLIIMK